MPMYIRNLSDDEATILIMVASVAGIVLVTLKKRMNRY